MIHLTIWCSTVSAQAWLHAIHDPRVSFHDAQANFNDYWKDKAYEKGKGWKQYKRWENFMESRVNEAGFLDPGKVWEEIACYKAYSKSIHTLKDNSVSSNWSFIGPYNVPEDGPRAGGLGRLNCILVHPDNPDNLFVGTPSGGLWYTEDQAASWETETDFLPSLGISNIVIAPSNPNVMYASTGDDDGGQTYSIGILKSTDGGMSWSIVGLDPTQPGAFVPNLVKKMIVHPDDSETILAATAFGIYKSTDGGTNWGMIVGPGWFKDIVYKPGNPDIVYAAGYSLLDGNVFAKFYRSTDSGNSWTVMNSGIPVDAIGRMAIGVTEANPDIVYVNATDFYTGGFYGFYKSFDSGVSFNLQSSNPNIVLGQGAYNLVVAVSNDDPDLVFAGGVSLFKSTNGGVSWTETIGAEGSSNYVHVDMHDLQIVHSGTEEHLYVACDGGIFKSENLGQTWTDLSNGLPITQFYRLGMSAQNSHCILAGSQDNGAIFHDKRSSAWSNLFNSDVMECLIDPFYPDSVYFVVQGGRVWKSTDFGFETVIAPSDVGIYEGAAWTTPFVMHPNRPEELCIGYQSIWRTNNKGETWENFSGVLTNDNSVLRDIILAPSAPDQHVYATDGAAIFTTHDSGATWQTYMPPVANSFIKDIAVHNNIPTTLWICTSWGEVFKSTDGGANWTSVSGLLPQINANTIVHQKGSDDGIYVGMDVGIYYKDNSMSDWESFSDDLPNVIVSELEIDYCNGKIVAATFGRGLWESDLAILDGFSAGIKCKVALEAPYDPGSQMMSTTLLDNQLIPLTHPYHVEPWNYLGNERVSALEEFPSNMVDWVLLELRSTDDFSVVSQKAALLLNDGYIIDVNGSEYVNFCGVDTESVYHLVVRHRNHLAIMSNSVVDFSNGNAFYDFTISEAQAMGNEQQKLSSNGNYMLHAGDLNSDGVITVSDLNFYTSEVSLFDMYLDSDCNMDRAVTVNDYNYYQLNTSIIGISQVRY